eukprot:scaffold310345_cov18-Prasinocladus_malaysianus.AAC.1
MVARPAAVLWLVVRLHVPRYEYSYDVLRWCSCSYDFELGTRVIPYYVRVEVRSSSATVTYEYRYENVEQLVAANLFEGLER